ncbi:hypothetical protein A0J48_007590 [Sphaerospermopsis aphanizomenoides BCCUSP55]|uniref:hypothetical protein n=1 Tax=Sphaerospermopsis aphanizomenoides TaxID=459663 RepID=UPI000AF7B48A|nr:hypothetical protein [Sphaerospermopsis aphanizomenoides]MBK1987399.1 hypothetical protein [Sphaerospermopsis aphanizomenoides BCCUSP55]
MAVARKSAVSTKNSWFKRNSDLPLGQQRSRAQGKSTQTSSTLANESTGLHSRRRRNSSRNLLFTSTKEPVAPTLVPGSGKQPAANIDGQVNERLPMMSAAGAAPVWLLRLYTIYRYSSAAAFLVVAATLMVYGWTVYSQELWSQAYRTLQSLQRNERQLTTTNATLTSKMADEAEQPSAGLVSPSPGNTIFLPPNSDRPNSASSHKIPNSEAQPQTLSPLGY